MNLIKRPFNTETRYSPFVVIAFITVTGIAITFYLFSYFAQTDQDRLHERMDIAMQVLSREMVSPMNSTEFTMQNTLVNDFVEIRLELDKGAELTEELIKDHIDLEYYGGFSGGLSGRFPLIQPGYSWVRYYEKTDLAENPDALSTIRFPDPLTTSSLEQRQYRPERGISVENRQVFYPIRINIGSDRSDENLGFDYYSDPMFQAALDQARDTGRLTVHRTFPMGERLSEYSYNHYFYPLYMPGSSEQYPVYKPVATPETVTARRENLAGFLSLVTTNVSAQPETRGIDMVYFPDTNAFTSDDILAGNLRSALSSRNISTQMFTFNGFDRHMLVRPLPELAETFITSNRWWALAIGLMLTAWFNSLIISNYRHSRRVMGQVEERTKTLEERTEKLAVQSRELIRINEALHESELRYRMLAENVSDVIFTCDMNGMCTYISPSVLSQTGHSPDEFIHKPISHYLGNRYETVLSSSQPCLFNRTSSDGVEKWLEASVTHLRDDNGNPVGTMGVTRDVSGRIRSEKEKEKLESDIRQSQKMEAIGNLAGGVAHDFNNLLTGILGHTDILKLERPISKDNLRSLSVIETAALRAKELTNQLLGFARKGQYATLPVDINLLINDVTALMERTVDKRIEMEMNFADNPRPFTLGDPGQISQVLLNIAVNARDAMPKGGKLSFLTELVSISPEHNIANNELEPGDYCHIRISDTGQGIPDDIADNIFEPFFTTKDEGKGTGMGLAMAYGVIRNHGGLITLDRSVTEGAAFDIYLPYHESEAGKDDGELQDLQTGSGKVLMIDDEEIVQELSTTMLEHLGYKVLLASDGIEGIEIYRKHWKEISFVIVDVIMPRMNGIDCLKELKAVNPDIRAILTTGYSRESLDQPLKDNIAQCFLEKPYRLRDLAEAIEITLQDE